jgi:hypothetical protein
MDFHPARVVDVPLGEKFNEHDRDKMPLHHIKQLLRRAFPGVVQKRNTRRFRSQVREAYFDRQHANARRLFGANPPSVLLGPFAGTKYFNEVVWGPIEPKWIGYYEAELHSIFESMQPDAYDVIVDVGSAEGYYSVAMARKFKKAKVVSYDSDPWAREQQARLADINGCKNISIRRCCAPRDLEADIKHSKRTLLICDIEGFEYELLNPIKVPSLTHADILIEIHFSLDERKLSVDDGCQEFIQRFHVSHTPQIISVEPRDLDLINSKLPMSFSMKSDLAEAVDEHRPSFQKWLWLEAKTLAK